MKELSNSPKRSTVNLPYADLEDEELFALVAESCPDPLTMELLLRWEQTLNG